MNADFKVARIWKTKMAFDQAEKQKKGLCCRHSQSRASSWTQFIVAKSLCSLALENRKKCQEMDEPGDGAGRATRQRADCFTGKPSRNRRALKRGQAPKGDV